jgi:hypothetical protein
MPKYDVGFSWCSTIRGYEQITVEAENEQEAKDKAKDALDIDYNNYCKIINNDWDINSVTEVKD